MILVLPFPAAFDLLCKNVPTNNHDLFFLQAHWDPTTPFPSSIGPLGPGSGLRILSFRTVKADVVVGLPKGKDEELRATEGGGGDSGARKWAWGGRWAVVSLSDGKQ